MSEDSNPWTAMKIYFNEAELRSQYTAPAPVTLPIPRYTHLRIPGYPQICNLPNTIAAELASVGFRLKTYADLLRLKSIAGNEDSWKRLLVKLKAIEPKTPKPKKKRRNTSPRSKRARITAAPQQSPATPPLTARRKKAKKPVARKDATKSKRDRPVPSSIVKYLRRHPDLLM
jgi:hypothetical protein